MNTAQRITTALALLPVLSIGCGQTTKNGVCDLAGQTITHELTLQPGSSPCRWEKAGINDDADCAIDSITIRGNGSQPDPNNLGLTYARTNSSDDQSRDKQTTSASGSGWEKNAAGLVCSTSGCAAGDYSVTIEADPDKDCSDYGPIFIDIKYK